MRPEGRLIPHRRGRGLALVVLAAVVSALVLAPAALATTPHPNGQIAFARFDPALDDTVVYIVGSDGSGLHQAIPGTPIPGECPHWSPDGTRIATCGTALPNGQGGATMIIDARTGSYTQLPAPDPTLSTACNTWSPDGTRLACEAWDDSNPARDGIYTIRSADGGDLVRLTANPTGGGHDLPGAYSPEGRRLLFVRTDADGNAFGLFVVNVNGTGLKQITPPGMIGISGASWSPQGNMIVFSMRIRAGQRRTIWTIHSDGSRLAQVPIQLQPACGGSVDDPASVGCVDPRWSPDGQQIVFQQFTPLASSIDTVDADGSNLRQLTTSPTEDDAPDWGAAP